MTAVAVVVARGAKQLRSPREQAGGKDGGARCPVQGRGPGVTGPGGCRCDDRCFRAVCACKALETEFRVKKKANY